MLIEEYDCFAPKQSALSSSTSSSSNNGSGRYYSNTDGLKDAQIE
jgi:hypothetical protein